jgi:hypothetical protein
MKMEKNLVGLCASALMIFASSSAYAGAGANVYGCVNLTTKPPKPLTVQLTAGGSGTHCMNDVGSDTNFSAANQGLNCASVGYVESKASSTKGDLCATDESHWMMSYNIEDTSFSGSTNSNWHTGNSMSLYDQIKNTVVCNTEAICDSTSVSWDSGTQGPIYIIFQPQAK